MIISWKNKYIYIAVPKTGTTSVQKLIMKHDPTARKYNIEIKGKEYSFNSHYTAKEIRDILGKELYSQFTVFGFIRDPHSRIVSSYHFYKNGDPFRNWKTAMWHTRFKILYALLMPFKLWSLTYPYRSNIEYFTDENGEIIVDMIGTFETLTESLSTIMKFLNMNIPVSELPHVNKSKHTHYKDYFQSKIFNRMIEKIIRDDREFYDMYSA